MKLRMKLLLAVAFLVVTCASAQEEFKCVAPPVWYADFMEFSPSRMEEQRGRFFYDEASERIAVKDEIIEGLNTTNYWEIFDHKSDKGYSINETLKECRVFTLREDFPKIGPYLSDKFLGDYTIGSSAKEKDGVQVVVYSGSNERGDFFGVWIPSGPDSCLPVSESFTSRVDKSFNSRRYYNIRLGIFDDNVFVPPSYC